MIEQGEYSFALQAQEEFRRSLTLAAASYFEKIIQDIVKDHVKSKSNNCLEIISLVEIKVISRQYHTWFDWKNLKDNTFWGMFGAEFKDIRVKEIKGNADLGEASRSFLMIGSLRNQIVHQNFGSFEVPNSVEEIYEFYKRALLYIDYCQVVLI
ncbi:HEPN domain-containing protein [Deinococcus frigens]|uniref:HEPN domain-containing protein n=1 Tax=Deinococcus frigens TaxID=249403 RepID=UPI0012EC403E|nr:HEPN domain-containing protein [Deinococcus frigens]